MLATLLFAHAAPPSVATSTASSIQAWIANKRTEVPYSVAPGVSVVVTVNDDVGMWGDGLQDLFAGIPADADTLYEIGSLSKTMSALALAALVTRGVVSWDDPVRKWLGESFAIGPYPYVSKVLTLRDLLSHRTGLNEGQGDFGGYYLRSDEYMRRLAKIDPVHTLRERMDYSNTGWVVAGQVLAAAANASSWCAALKAVLLEPLHMSATYCQRNELSDAADRHLAAVHKCDPCSAARRGATVARAAPPVATYSFVRTGGASDFAWGAADPAGSVISSVRDMSRVLNMLLGVTTSPLLHPSVLREMMTGQMVTPRSWLAGCGVAGWTGPDAHTAGHVASVGLGFDLVMEIELAGKRVAYAEKNGDTDMHKARLGLLPELNASVLLLSNLGGSVGGPLTALKFGALALLVGGTAADADAAAALALNTTAFWTEQWPGMSTCTDCGTAGERAAPCLPAGLDVPPLPASQWAGEYGTAAYGARVLNLTAADDGEHLLLSFGPSARAALTFSNTSRVAQHDGCAAVADLLRPLLPPWSAPEVSASLSALEGQCSLAEWVLPPEAIDAGISVAKGTAAFPWACGPFPLPDGPSIYVVSHEGAGVLAMHVDVGEVFWALAPAGQRP